MKRILSVILSLALLASLLIIPMSVSADTLSEADKAVYTDLISAVDNLKLDFDFAQESNLLVETAYPIGSQVNTGTGLHATDSILNQDKVYDNTDEDTVPDKIGSKYVSVEKNENIKTGFWNINTSHLHTIRCQYDTQPVNDSYPNSGTTGLFSLKDSGYLVVYVKTARPFKLGVNFSNNQATPAVEKDVVVTSGYVPVIIDMNNIDWPTLSSDGYATNNKNWGYFLTIRQMTSGEQTITSDDQISFGSVFTIPVDTNVRDFKYIIDAAAKPKPTTAKRFDVNANDFDPAAMIIAAEKITNDGRYTVDSWTALQSAITTAKESFLRTAIADTANGVSNIKTLLLSELEDAGTVEEVWQPKWVKGTGDFSSTENVYNPADGATGDTIIDTNASYFGSCVAKLDSTHKTLSIIGNGASTPFGDGSTPIDVNDYADVWMYVYNNTASAVQPDQFIVVSTGSDNVDYKIGLLPQGLIRIDIASILKKANDQKKNDSKWNTNRIQLKNSNITDGATYYGTVFGLKQIDITELTAATTVREIVNFYINRVFGKNYTNTARADETMDITTGIVLDTTAPIANITDKGTYYGSLTVSVIDDYVDTVTLNGKEVQLNHNEEFTVSPAEGVQKIVITDMAGNKAEYEVTVLEVKGLDAESEAQGEKVVLTVDSKDKDSVDKTSKDKIDEKLEKGEKIAYFEIDLTKVSGGAITNATNVFEIKIPFDFAGKNTNVRVLHNHDGVVRVLDELTARPTGDLEDGKFYADKENNMIYIYTSKFSTFAVTYHTHTVKHVAATVATAEADGNIEYWYCEECGKYFSDAAATKEISKADTVVKYVAPSNGNTGSGSNTSGGTTDTGNSNAGTTLPGGTTDTGNSNAGTTLPGGISPGTGQTAMTVVLFAILLGAIAVMGISIVKSRKAKSK